MYIELYRQVIHMYILSVCVLKLTSKIMCHEYTKAIARLFFLMFVSA